MTNSSEAQDQPVTSVTPLVARALTAELNEPSNRSVEQDPSTQAAQIHQPSDTDAAIAAGAGPAASKKPPVKRTARNGSKGSRAEAEELERGALSADEGAAQSSVKRLALMGPIALNSLATVMAYGSQEIAGVAEEALRKCLQSSDEDTYRYIQGVLNRPEANPRLTTLAATALTESRPREAVHRLVPLLSLPDQWLVQQMADLLARPELTPNDFSRKDIDEIWLTWLYRTNPDPVSLIAVLQRIPKSEDKLASLLSVAGSNATVTRDMLTEGYLRFAIVSSDSDSSDIRAVTKAVIEHAARQPDDIRVVEICAGALVGIAGGSKAAGHLLNDYVGDTIRPELDPLRMEIGGSVALRPMILEGARRFDQQTAKLREKSLSDWRSALLLTTVGFVIQILMSVVIFVLGAIITIVATQEVIGNGQGDELFGPGVTLAAGLASMFAVIYLGPLKNVRESVLSRGLASIGFTTYMHRLALSTFYMSSEVTSGRINERTLTAIGKDLEDASQDAMRILRAAARSPKDSQDHVAVEQSTGLADKNSNTTSADATNAAGSAITPDPH